MEILFTRWSACLTMKLKQAPGKGINRLEQYLMREYVDGKNVGWKTFGKNGKLIKTKNYKL